ncbi:unnamed protein product [Prunus armeniaca]
MEDLRFTVGDGLAAFDFRLGRRAANPAPFGLRFRDLSVRCDIFHRFYNLRLRHLLSLLAANSCIFCLGIETPLTLISVSLSHGNGSSDLVASKKCLIELYDLLISHKEELGQLITLEQGKPLKEAIGEVSYGAGFIELYAKEAKRVYGDIIPPTLSDRRLFVLKQFPLDSIPTDFPLGSLVVLEMQYSGLRQVFKGTKRLSSLKILDLSHSHSLTEITDFSFCPNLEKLILVDCERLVDVNGSIGNLERLVYLSMEDCKNIRMLPENMGRLKLLETLIISGCTSLNAFPIEMLRNMESLKVLLTDGIPIGELRPGRSSCILSSLPCSLVDLSLQECNLSNDAFPREFSNLSSLRRLNLGNNPICSLPNCIKDLMRLDELCFSRCKNLKSLLGLPKLSELDIGYCESLETITYQCSRFRKHSTELGENCNLVEWEYDYKLEPIGSVDAEMINLLGLSNLESMAPIRIQKPLYYGTEVHRSPVQGLYEDGMFSTFFAGNEVPGRFSHKSRRSSISFTVTLPDKHRIQALVVFAVYASSGSDFPRKRSTGFLGVSGDMMTRVRNKSKGLKWYCGPTHYGIPGEGEDMIWLSHWKFQDDHLEGGDRVGVSVVTQPCFRVKELGIQIVQEQEENHNTMISTQNKTFQLLAPTIPWQNFSEDYLFNDEDSDEDTADKEEQQDDHAIAAATGSNKFGGLRGWKVLITAACFFVALSLITRSSLSQAGAEFFVHLNSTAG